MLRNMFKAKLHRATVTDANLNYEGSVTIDKDLLDASGILEFEKVDIWNITNGSRFSTYVLEGRRGSGEICLNGAAARLVQVGDRVIIATFAMMDEKELEGFKPTVVQLDEQNRIISKDGVLV
ncbi:aspartate 1-decarboxylase [Geovibrio thiophilus]|uniref:Aspartate 1-decarboxylase n=1 Tax=Geovibrio thiophilus TaxID=139438 RepID=A0A3R5UUX7_9BACT|nr:aspartate 1-decarboxylase [Geovibrio thiophilus]QAR33273.1 aspartate 1-decarboxylase [Geovibrio thiophilus]